MSIELLDFLPDFNILKIAPWEKSKHWRVLCYKLQAREATRSLAFSILDGYQYNFKTDLLAMLKIYTLPIISTEKNIRRYGKVRRDTPRYVKQLYHVIVGALRMSVKIAAGHAR